MLNVPPGRTPSVDSGVLVVTGTVLVPVAGVVEAVELDDVDDADAVVDEAFVVEPLEEPSSTCCMRAVN